MTTALSRNQITEIYQGGNYNPLVALFSGSVTSGSLNSGSVQGYFGSTRNIASGTTGAFDFGSGAVNSGHLASGAITGRAGGAFNIGSGSIGRFDVGSGAINSGHVGSGSVVGNAGAGRSIASGTVARFDIPLAYINELSGCVVVGSGVVEAIGVGHRLGVRENAGTINPQITTVGYTNTAARGGVLGVGHARGTVASPTALQSGDILGYFQALAQYDTAVGQIAAPFSIQVAMVEACAVTNFGVQVDVQTIASGSATAATRLGFDYEGKVFGTTFASGTINSGAILSGQLMGFELGSGAIVSGHIASGQIGRFHIASGRLAGFELGSGAIVSGRVASGQIGFGHLADGSVQSGTVASGRLFSFHLQSGTIFAGAGIGVTIYESGITVANLSGAGGAASLASGDVKSGHIASGAVQGFFGSTRHIASGTVGAWDFGSGAVIAGAVGSGAIQSGNIGTNAIGSGELYSGQIGGIHLLSGRFHQTDEDKYYTPMPVDMVDGAKVGSRASQVNLEGATYWLSRPVQFTHVQLWNTTKAGVATGRLLIYQASDGTNTTGNLIATCSGISGASASVILAPVAEGTALLRQGVFYLLWGKDSSGGNNVTIQGWIPGGIDNMFHMSGVQSGTGPPVYVTNIAASGTPPSTFLPQSGTAAAVSGFSTGAIPTIILRTI